MMPARSSRLGRLRAPQRQPEAGLRQPRSRASHLARSSGISPKLTSRSSESRARAFCFLTCLFFCSRRWDTLFSLVGHPPRCRQEAGRDDVGIDATRAPLARDDALLGQLGQMAGHRAPGRPCGPARVRTEGKHRPVRSAKATRFCSVQCRWRRTVRYRSRVTGTNESKGASRAAEAPAGKRRRIGHTSPVARRRLRKSARSGKLVVARRTSFPASAGNADPPLRRVLLFWVRCLAVLRERAARRIPRAWRAWRNIFRPATEKVKIVTRP